MKKYPSRSKLLKQRYNISVTQWNKLYKLQNGKCPICDKPIYKPKNKLGVKAACVDHDHKTKRVRGLLHFGCNKYKVSSNTLESAKRIVAYLELTIDGREL